MRRSDGSQTSKRGFTSQRAAADARRRLIEQVERREVVHTTETFGRYRERWLARRRPYLEAGTWSGYEVSGRKRLLPAFADARLGALSVDGIRGFIADQAEAVEAGDVAAKTVNNALVTLVVCLNDAVEDGLIAANPALRVDRLPAAHIEREYLRLHEIPIYLDSCDLLCLDLDAAEEVRAALDPARAASLAGLLKLVSDPTRLLIVQALGDRELCGCDLGWVTGHSDEVVSHHLGRVRGQGLIQSRRDGKVVCASLTDRGRELAVAGVAEVAAVAA